MTGFQKPETGDKSRYMFLKNAFLKRGTIFIKARLAPVGGHIQPQICWNLQCDATGEKSRDTFYKIALAEFHREWEGDGVRVFASAVTLHLSSRLRCGPLQVWLGPTRGDTRGAQMGGWSRVPCARRGGPSLAPPNKRSLCAAGRADAKVLGAPSAPQ